jgi:hypothetical protein
MPKRKPNKAETIPLRIKLTARLSLKAYDALSEIQRQHRKKTGRALALWKIIDVAIIAYAKRKRIHVRE